MADKRTSSARRVAAAATEKNGLKLGELSLIGVFGSDANRRALIRHPSGKVQSVKMGQRVSGGKVVAIGRTELFLRSGSRTRKLELPG